MAFSKKIMKDVERKIRRGSTNVIKSNHAVNEMKSLPKVIKNDVKTADKVLENTSLVPPPPPPRPTGVATTNPNKGWTPGRGPTRPTSVATTSPNKGWTSGDHSSPGVHNGNGTKTHYASEDFVDGSYSTSGVTTSASFSPTPTSTALTVIPKAKGMTKAKTEAKAPGWYGNLSDGHRMALNIGGGVLGGVVAANMFGGDN